MVPQHQRQLLEHHHHLLGEEAQLLGHSRLHFLLQAPLQHFDRASQQRVQGSLAHNQLKPLGLPHQLLEHSHRLAFLDLALQLHLPPFLLLIPVAVSLEHPHRHLEQYVALSSSSGACVFPLDQSTSDCYVYIWQGGGGLFGQQPPAQSNALALIPSQQAQQAQASAQYQVLITKENKPIVHSTAWDDIHPEGQKYLLELECACLSSQPCLAY